MRKILIMIITAGFMSMSTTVLAQEGKDESMEKATYLGIVTTSVEGALATQLDLPRGVGLTVDYIDPDSPVAGKLEQHDVLHKINGQILVNHPQLSVLIRSMKPGDEVNIDLLRKGKPLAVKVTLAEKALPPLSSMGQDPFPHLHINPPRMHSFKFDDNDWLGPKFGPDFFDNMEKNLQQMGFGRDWMKNLLEERDKGWLKELMKEMNQAEKKDSGRQEESRQDINSPRKSGAKSEVRTFHSSSGSYSIADNEHSITLTINNGNKHLAVTDKEGKVIFDGPVNTKEEREKIPADVLSKVQNIEGMKDEIAPGIEDEPKELHVL